MKDKLLKYITRTDNNLNSVLIKALFSNDKHKEYSDPITEYLCNEAQTLSSQEKIWLYLNDKTDAPRCQHGIAFTFKDFKRNYEYQVCQCVPENKSELDEIRNELKSHMANIHSKQLPRVLLNERFKYAINTYQQLPEGTKDSEKYYLFIHEMKQPKCSYGNPLTFKTVELGYNDTCVDKKCKCRTEKRSASMKETYKNNPELVKLQGEHLQNILIEKYGEGYHNNPEYRKKTEETNLVRYGTKYPIYNKHIKEKMFKTNQERYGVDWPLQNKDIQKKTIDTSLERYGSLMTHAREKANELYNGVNPFVVFKDKIDKHWEDRGIRHNKQSHFAEETVKILHDKDLFASFVKGKERGQIEIDLNISPDTLRRYLTEYSLEDTVSSKSRSRMEIELVNILREKNIKFVSGNRSILGNMELDFYFPDHNFAIELNGLYWHRSEIRDSTYHKEKHDRCLEKGIKLFQFWEDEWNNNSEVIVNHILSYMRSYENVVYSVSNEDHSSFIDSHDIRGSIACDFSLVGKVNEEIVSVLSIKEYEGNYYVVRRGFFGKHIISHSLGKELYMFCDMNRDSIFGEYIDSYSPDFYYTNGSDKRMLEESNYKVYDSGHVLVVI